MIKRAKISRPYLILCWSFFILILLTYPFSSDSSSTISLTYPDKIIHFLLFFVFSFLIINYFSASKKRKLVFISAVSASFIYAFILEVIQTYIPGRSYSNTDILAGVLGAGAATIFFYLRSAHSCSGPKS
jgi:VanZ family protein